MTQYLLQNPGEWAADLMDRSGLVGDNDDDCAVRQIPRSRVIARLLRAVEGDVARYPIGSGARPMGPPSRLNESGGSGGCH